MSIHHPDPSDHLARSTTGRREKTEREVMCKVCQAVYVPARTHLQLTRSPHPVIESAFMSMCHFCFRCRRPACPSCWDEVHSVCGACALEAHLPFRASVPPLDGVVFPPIQHLPLARVRTVTPPLVCVRPGRFQHAPLPIETQTTLYLQTVSDQPNYDAGTKQLAPETPIPPSEPQAHAIEDVADMATRPDKRRVQSKEISRNAATHHNRLKRTVAVTLSLIVLLVVVLVAGALLLLR